VEVGKKRLTQTTQHHGFLRNGKDLADGVGGLGHGISDARDGNTAEEPGKLLGFCQIGRARTTLLME
jgi:hypothetical protein